MVVLLFTFSKVARKKVGGLSPAPVCHFLYPVIIFASRALNQFLFLSPPSVLPATLQSILCGYFPIITTSSILPPCLFSLESHLSSFTVVTAPQLFQQLLRSFTLHFSRLLSYLQPRDYFKVPQTLDSHCDSL